MLDYGAVALSSACHSATAKLDTVQATALRICCGAMKGTSLSALQNECGEMPLSLRRHKEQIDYCIKVKCITNHSCASIFVDHWTNHYGMKAVGQLNRSIYSNVECFFSTFKENLEQRVSVLDPPWCNKSVSYDLSLSNLIR